MFCPKCGTNNPDGVKFCTHCGASLNGNTPNQTTIINNINTGSTGPWIKRRNIAACIIFSILTCGIYIYYWLYTTTEDVNAISRKSGSASGGMVILLSIITCGIYLLYHMYRAGKDLEEAKVARNMPSGNLGILYLVLSIFGLSLIALALMQDEINHYAS